MPEALPEQLRTAAELIKNSQIQEARAILASYVRLHPSSEEAWFLLSYVAPQKSLQVDCLMKVLSLNPNHTEAKNRLLRLNPPSQAPISPVVRPNTESKKPSEIISPVGQSNPDESQLQPPPSSPPGKAKGPDESTALLSPTHFADPFPEKPIVSPDFQHPTLVEKEAEIPVPPFEDSVSSLFSSVESSNASAVFLPKEPIAPPPQLEPITFKATENSPRKAKSSKKKPRIGVYILEILGVIVVIGALLYVNTFRPGILNAPQPTATKNYRLSLTPKNTPFITNTIVYTLSPSPTNTLVPTATETPTGRPTRTITPSLTIVPVDESVSLSMDEIQKQVIGLRTLPYKGPDDRSQINVFDAQQQIRGELFTPDYLSKLKIQSQALSILGLIMPNTDLSNQVINQLADPYGGIYLPWRQEIIVTGLRFNAVARYNYAQEFDHYLIDTNFNGAKLGIGPLCPYDLQRCQAINAFFQGDGVLLMNQWAKKYANQTDNQEITAYTPQAAINKEPAEQPYLTKNLSFPYIAGYNFVKALFDKGGWATVNLAFKNPPASTMQILHPNLFLAGNKPVVEALPDAHSGLGGSWNLFDHNVLGEWNTYLLLGYGPDEKSRVDDGAASYASVGWAGDEYQIYTNPDTKKTAIVAKWEWTSENDRLEFQDVMGTHLKGLYREGVQNNQPNGTCWIQPDQIGCIYGIKNQNIWIVAPDQLVFETLLKQFPDFP